MNNLLIFFAFPIFVIIFSIVLQKLLDNPLTVAALTFAVFLVITFAFFDETFLIATLVYTILAFVTAVITDRLCGCNNTDLSNIIQNFEHTNSPTEDETKNTSDFTSNNYGCEYYRKRRKYY